MVNTVHILISQTMNIIFVIPTLMMANQYEDSCSCFGSPSLTEQLRDNAYAIQGKVISRSKPFWRYMYYNVSVAVIWKSANQLSTLLKKTHSSKPLIQVWTRSNLASCGEDLLETGHMYLLCGSISLDSACMYSCDGLHQRWDADVEKLLSSHTGTITRLLSSAASGSIPTVYELLLPLFMGIFSGRWRLLV